MKEYRKYSIKQNRFQRSFLAGFEVDGDDSLRLEENVYHRFFICDSIDGVEKGALWGRIHMDWELSEDMLVIVHVAASDNKSITIREQKLLINDVLKDADRSIEEKLNLISDLDEKKQVNKKDLLLYELKGRYLYLVIEVRGLGTGSLSNLFITNQEDILKEKFPQVYQEYGSFYHRYLSVFSTMYMEFQEKIEQVSKILDVDTAPVQMLPMFAQWMGVEISCDFLPEDKLRTLVKEAYKLNRIKGTKEAVSRICEIVLDEKPMILEKNILQNHTQAEEPGTYEMLYGDGTFDVTILVQKCISEEQKRQLLFLLNQFKPVRCHIKLRYLEKKGNLDNHIYMDMNAALLDSPRVALDDNVGLDNQMILL